MGKGTSQADEAGIEPRQLLGYQKKQSLTMAAAGIVALVIGLILGEDGGPWWSFSPVLAIWAMPGIQLWRSAGQIHGNLPRLPTRPARSRQPRYLRPLVAVMVVLFIGLLATEPQAALAAIAVGVVTYGLLCRVEMVLGRHQDRQLVIVTRSARYVPWLTYRWGDAEGSEQSA
jgi:hypothetical protein